MKLWVKIIGGLAGAGIIAVFLVYFFIYDKPHTDYANAEATCSLTTSELFEAYTADKYLADSLYTGNVLLVKGSLTKTEAAGSLVVAVFVFKQGLFGDEGVRCTLLPDFYKTIALMNSGDLIVLKGYCAGYNNTDVILEYCSIIN